MKSRLPEWNDLITKILIRNPKDTQYILENLIIFLEKDKKVEVLDIVNTMSKKNDKLFYLRFLLTIRFNCYYCKAKGMEEQINLRNPLKDHACESCVEKMADYIADAKGEEDYAERLKRKEI